MSERKGSATFDAALAFIIRILSAGLVFGLQVLLARLMNGAEYGGAVALWTWLIAIGSFGAIGFAEASVRFLPRYHARGRETRVRNYWRFGLATVAVTSTGLAILAMIPALLLRGEAPSSLIFFYVALGLPFIAVEYYLEGVARSFGWFRLTTVPVYIVRPILIGGICLALASAGVELTLAVVGAVMVGAMAAVSCALMLAIAWRLHSPERAAPSTFGQKRLWIRAALPLVLVSGLEDLATSSDVLILSLLMPMEDVGVYFAAARVLALANFVHYAIYLVSGRAFALALADRGGDALQDSVLETARLTFWTTLAALAVTLAAGPFLLAAFGEAFVSGYGVMVILAAGVLARSIAGQAGELLIVSGRQRQAATIAGSALVLNAALAFVLIPGFGLHGAAAATALTLAARTAVLTLFIRRSFGFRAVALGLPRLRVPAA